MKNRFLQRVLMTFSQLQSISYKTITSLFLIISLLIATGEIFARNSKNDRVMASTELTGEISGTGGLCQGMTALITLIISDGTPPYTVTLTRSGSLLDKDTILSEITALPLLIAVNIAGTYTLKSLADSSLNAGNDAGDPVVLTEMPVPIVELHGLLPAYDKNNDQMVLLSGTPSGGTFTGSGLFTTNDSCYFLPSFAPVGTNQIVYSYRESETSCFGYDTAIVSIWKGIAYMEFPENRSEYCSGEPLFIIKGYNLANDTGSFLISGGVGLTDNNNNTAVIDPSLLSSGQYTVTYTFYDGTTLNVKDTINVLGMDNTITQNSNVLVANFDGADFQWIDCTNDNTPLEGQTNKVFIAPFSGSYAVIIMLEGCVDTSLCYEIMLTEFEKQLKGEIEVYPNPVKETFFINLGKLVTEAQIMITEISGRVIQKENYRNVQLIELSLTAPPGTYLLLINTRKEKVIFPLVRN